MRVNETMTKISVALLYWLTGRRTNAGMGFQVYLGHSIWSVNRLMYRDAGHDEFVEISKAQATRGDR